MKFPDARKEPALGSRRMRVIAREVRQIENRLRTTAPSSTSIVELSLADFERFGESWGLATPEEAHSTLTCMVETLFVEFRTVQAVEVVPKTGF